MVSLGLTVYIFLTYQNLVQTHTDLVPAKYRNFALFCSVHSLFLCYYYISCTHICYKLNNTSLKLLVYFTMSSKEAETRMESKYIFVELLILTLFTFFFLSSSFLPADSNSHVTSPLTMWLCPTTLILLLSAVSHSYP